MLEGYGPVPEYFEIQNTAIQHFNPTSSTSDLSNIILVVGGIIIISVTCYYTYQYFEDRKAQARYLTI